MQIQSIQIKFLVMMVSFLELVWHKEAAVQLRQDFMQLLIVQIKFNVIMAIILLAVL